MSVLLYLLALVVVWVLAWGSLTFANVLGGVVVGGLLMWLAPDTWTKGGRLRIRPIAFVKFASYVLYQVMWSNVTLVMTVLQPSKRLHTGVMQVDLPGCSDGLLTVIANVLALTPGTNPVHVTRHPMSVYVHVLDMRNPEHVTRDVRKLANLAIGAFGP